MILRIIFCGILYNPISLVRKQRFSYLSEHIYWVSSKAMSRMLVSDCEPLTLPFYHCCLILCNCPVIPGDDILNAFRLKRLHYEDSSVDSSCTLKNCKCHPNQINPRLTISDSGIDKCFVGVFASHDIIPRSER